MPSGGGPSMPRRPLLLPWHGWDGVWERSTQPRYWLEVITLYYMNFVDQTSWDPRHFYSHMYSDLRCFQIWQGFGMTKMHKCIYLLAKFQWPVPLPLEHRNSDRTAPQPSKGCQTRHHDQQTSRLKRCADWRGIGTDSGAWNWNTDWRGSDSALTSAASVGSNSVRHRTGKKTDVCCIAGRFCRITRESRRATCKIVTWIITRGTRGTSMLLREQCLTQVLMLDQQRQQQFFSNIEPEFLAHCYNVNVAKNTKQPVPYLCFRKRVPFVIDTGGEVTSISVKTFLSSENKMWKKFHKWFTYPLADSPRRHMRTADYYTHGHTLHHQSIQKNNPNCRLQTRVLR